MGLGKACVLQGIHGMAIPNALNAAQAHLGGNPFGGSVLFCFWLRSSRGPRPYGHWCLAYALPKSENTCCDAHSALLDTLLVVFNSIDEKTT